jgi:PiT family inorganic phosphate transporter
MDGGTALVFVFGFVVAFVNGANDVSKGVATLVGSGLATERRAIAWGAGWTAVGAFLGAIFAGAMVTTFGKGLLAADATPSLPAAVAALAGAGGWVLVATRTGLPVSTTHAIVGSLAGVGAFAHGPASVQWTAIGAKVVAPLLLGPIVAFAITALVARRRRAARAPDCLCIEAPPPAAAAAFEPRVATEVSAPLILTTGDAASCAERPTVARVTFDRVHWATSAAISVARAMNDAPKIAALIIAAAAIGSPRAATPGVAFLVVTFAMTAGSIAGGGRRVMRVMSNKIARFDRGDGFVANGVSAALVSGGAILGLPLSTTHVTTGAIVGGSRDVARGALRDVVLAWLVTVPAAALLGIAAYLVARVGLR